jgi:hypothetical protein
MKQDWLSLLYEKELKVLIKKIKSFEADIINEKTDLDR